MGSNTARVIELDRYREARTEKIAQANARAKAVTQAWMTMMICATMPAWAPVIVWVPFWRMAL